MADDKHSLQADGGGSASGKPDGVSEPQVSGRDAGGESAGGGYPNPHSGKEPKGGPDTFLGHGGQTDIDYSGPGQLAGKDTGEDSGRTGQGG